MPDDKTRDRYLQTTYGITLKEYNDILAFQGGGCACCGSKAKTRALHVDHSHRTGLVRGIVCAACNSAFRKLKDNPHIAEAAAHYLTYPPAQAVVGERVALVKPRRRRRRRRR